MRKAIDLVQARADTAAGAVDGIWQALSGARLLVTGGTGFVGCWLLHVLLAADRRHGLGIEATLITRDPAGFAARAPELASDPALHLIRADVLEGTLPDVDATDVVHAATETNVRQNDPDPLQLFDSSVTGTRRMLEWACRRPVRRFSLTSSGAVYAREALDEGAVGEDDIRAPRTDDLGAAYGHGKRSAEYYAATYGTRYGFEAKSARLFAFVGPYLPLGSGFAIGNFIRDALRGGEIVITGDGTPLRSYLDGADMAAWYWAVHVRGAHARVYNVGGADAVSIAELAQRVAVYAGSATSRVRISRAPAAGARPSSYVPSCERARRELGVRETTNLDAAIAATARWHTIRNGS